MRVTKPRVSPEIERMRKLFEKDKETEEKEVKTFSKIQNIKNSFELLMNPQKREREAVEERERERKRVERREKREQKQKREIEENRVKLVRERIRMQIKKPENTEKGVEQDLYIEGGKIPVKAEPRDKRKFERCGTDMGNHTPKLRKKERGGSEKMDGKWGKIQNMEETERVRKGALSSQTTDNRDKWQTELRKRSSNLETMSDRHETHSEGKLRNLGVKIEKTEKIGLKVKKKVQEQKGEGGSESHFEGKKPHVGAIPNQEK